MTYTLTSNEIAIIAIIIIGAIGLALLAALSDRDGNLRIR